MKKILIIILAVIMTGCQTKNNTLEFVVKSMLSTKDIPYLVQGADKKIDEAKFGSFYNDYVTRDCQKEMMSQLSIYQTTAQKLKVLKYKETELNNHILIECSVEMDDQRKEMIFHAQMDNNKVTSLKLIASKNII